MSSATGSELDEQAVMLDEFGGKKYIFLISNTKHFDKFFVFIVCSLNCARVYLTKFCKKTQLGVCRAPQEANLLDEFGSKNQTQTPMRP